MPPTRRLTQRTPALTSRIALLMSLSLLIGSACQPSARRVARPGALDPAQRPAPEREPSQDAQPDRQRLPPAGARGPAPASPRRAQGVPVPLPDAPTPSAQVGGGPFHFPALRDGSFSGILHGVGPMWTPTEMTGYREAFPSTRPALQRMGVNLADSPRTDWDTIFAEFRSWTDLFPTAIPVVTLKFDTFVDKETGRGLERDVLSGRFDHKLDDLTGLLASLDRPSFLRVGAEVNGPWNGYEPELYKRAFRYVVERLRAGGADRTVFVFNVKALPDDSRPMLDYDPGDDLADWWSIDLFSEDFRNDLVRAKVTAFLAEAARRGKPVMLPESCPSGMDLDDPRAWRDWFGPYFALVNGTPGVKAFLYSNRDFSTKDQRLKHWGDMRIDRSALAAAWALELTGKQYVHESHLAVP